MLQRSNLNVRGKRKSDRICGFPNYSFSKMLGRNPAKITNPEGLLEHRHTVVMADFTRHTVVMADFSH